MPRRKTVLTVVQTETSVPPPAPELPKTVWIRRGYCDEIESYEATTQLMELRSDTPAKVRKEPWRGEATELCFLHQVKDRTVTEEQFLIFYENRWYNATLDHAPKVVKVVVSFETYVTVEYQKTLEEVTQSYRGLADRGMGTRERGLPPTVESVTVTDYKP